MRRLLACLLAIELFEQAHKVNQYGMLDKEIWQKWVSWMEIWPRTRYFPYMWEDSARKFMPSFVESYWDLVRESGELDRRARIERAHLLDPLHGDDVLDNSSALGVELPGHADGFLTIGRLPDHLDIGHQVEEGAQAAPDHAMVVDQHHSNGSGRACAHKVSCFGASLQRTTSSVPCPGWLVTVNNAPTVSARSRIMLSP